MNRQKLQKNGQKADDKGLETSTKDGERLSVRDRHRWRGWAGGGGDASRAGAGAPRLAARAGAVNAVLVDAADVLTVVDAAGASVGLRAVRLGGAVAVGGAGARTASGVLVGAHGGVMREEAEEQQRHDGEEAGRRPHPGHLLAAARLRRRRRRRRPGAQSQCHWLAAAWQQWQRG